MAAALRFGPGVGLTTHALWCFSPTVLAHGSLATLDAWAAALSIVVLWAVVRFLEAPAAGWSAAVGLAVAGALASKATTLGLVPLALAAIAGGSGARRPRARGLRRGSREAGSVRGAMFGGLWAIYGFTIGPASLRSTGVLHLAPFPEWLVGLSGQLVHGFGEGHANYLFGGSATTAGGGSTSPALR